MIRRSKRGWKMRQNKFSASLLMYRQRRADTFEIGFVHILIRKKYKDNEKDILLMYRQRHFTDWLSGMYQVRILGNIIIRLSNWTIAQYSLKAWQYCYPPVLKPLKCQLIFQNSTRHVVGGLCVIFMTGRKLSWKRVVQTKGSNVTPLFLPPDLFCDYNANRLPVS